MNRSVAIIGGSTAGLFTASLLAHQGLHVKVFEATESIDPSPRTLIVTSRMPDLIGSLCESAVVNKIYRFELFADGKVATIPLRYPDLVIERSKLLQSLARQAEESGAKILNGHRFLNVKQNGKGLTLTLARNGDKDSIKESANILVGADGTFSKVARRAGWTKKPTVSLIQAVVELPKDMPSDTTRVWFLPEDTPYFYWLIPHSPTHGVLGLITEEDTKGRICLERFLDRKGFIPIDFQSAPISLFTQWTPIYRKIGGNRIYLVGDAAGHVKVTTVGGVLTGLRGALGVAEAILNGGGSRELKSLRRELGIHRLIRKSFHGFTQTDYVRLLDMLNVPTKRLLSVFTRDETPKLLLHLFLRQPRLLLFGLRALFIDRKSCTRR
ncbi:MAG: NAD(P)/FAD-dependent oxidoreductase [Methanosarcinaceae archaeon]|nr:NAD(P)/FAD-dependent oxidoreductase [Methanosarcinaceae archaeon]